MGVFSKLMFWKKEEALPDMGPDLGMGGEMAGMPDQAGGELGIPELGPPPEMPQMPETPGAAPGLEEVQPAQEPAPHHYRAAAPAPVQHAVTSGKDLEIISLKLDSLKTTLEAINERLARLEKMAEGGSESHRF